jgi:hypothetical protein
LTYVILEYEQDELQDATFKDEGTHPLFYNERKAVSYFEKNNLHGKIEEYDDLEYGEYSNGECDEAPEPMSVIEW